MKRNVKRLTLNRETVRRLNGEEMSAVQGGAPTGRITCQSLTCYCTVVSCESCPTECGGWYC